MTSTGSTRRERVSAVQLDAVGGIAGDMFSAALLDAQPDLWPACERAIAAVGLSDGARVSLAGHRDSMLAGSRFVVEGPAPHRHEHRHPGGRWPELRARMQLFAALQARGGLLAFARVAAGALGPEFRVVGPAQADAETAGDVVTITFADGARVVMNTQRPARQVWLAGGARAWHFSYDESREAWMDDKGQGDELLATLRALAAHAGVELPTS